MHIPVAIVKMIQALFGTKGANKEFIHTKHSHTDVDPNAVMNK
jgi:hypothetical protein